MYPLSPPEIYPTFSIGNSIFSSSFHSPSKRSKAVAATPVPGSVLASFPTCSFLNALIPGMFHLALSAAVIGAAIVGAIDLGLVDGHWIPFAVDQPINDFALHPIACDGFQHAGCALYPLWPRAERDFILIIRYPHLASSCIRIFPQLNGDV